MKSKKVILLHILIILSLYQCKKMDKPVFQEKIATVYGKIESYDGVFKSGKLSYFDAISRLEKNEIFVINSSGRFSINFTISHPIYDCAYLELQGNVYTPFLEPGKDLEIIISNNSINYVGENGLRNNQLIQLNDTLYRKFHTEIEHCQMLHMTNISFAEYLSDIEELSGKKLEFINDLEKTYKYDALVINALTKETYYSAARSWINFRWDYSSGRPQKRDTLIYSDFYVNMFKNYPLNDDKALVSRSFNDYISNIKTVFAENETDGSLVDYIRNYNVFNESELDLIKGMLNGDTTITKTNQFKQFYNTENVDLIWELYQKNRFSNILKSCEKLPKGIGRDVVLSQGMCSAYFSDSYFKPSEELWERLENMISSAYILNHLKKVNSVRKINYDTHKEELSEIPEIVRESAQNLNDSLLNKYSGKVIYIDFWATWCGPCREEIPHSKMLIEQFRNKDVVFLFLCSQSKKQEWEKLILEDKLDGEHYLLNDSEYNELSALYGISGFPTYVLINKNGKVINKNASRPSSGNVIIEEIQDLLK